MIRSAIVPVAGQIQAGNQKDLLAELKRGDLEACFFHASKRFQRGLGDAIPTIGLHVQSEVAPRRAKLFEGSRVIAVEEPAPNYFEPYVEFALADPQNGPAFPLGPKELFAKQQ